MNDLSPDEPQDEYTLENEEDEPVEVDISEFEDHVDFEIADWSGESRELLDSMLSTDGIAHIWQGTTLTVHTADEEAVQGLIDTVTATGAGGLDSTRARVVYEVGAWSAAMQTSLAEALGVAEIPYEWDEQGDLVVYEADEGMVEEILDAMPDPDDPDAIDADGVDVQDVLSKLWDSCGTLAKRPTDSDAVLAALSASGEVRHIALPFGFEPAVWRDIVARATQLNAALDSEDEDTQLTDDELQDACAELEARLHPLVAGPEGD